MRGNEVQISSMERGKKHGRMVQCMKGSSNKAQRLERENSSGPMALALKEAFLTTI